MSPTAAPPKKITDVTTSGLSDYAVHLVRYKATTLTMVVAATVVVTTS